MTTKPRAKKFRIRRSQTVSSTASPSAPAAPRSPGPQAVSPGSAPASRAQGGASGNGLADRRPTPLVPASRRATGGSSAADAGARAGRIQTEDGFGDMRFASAAASHDMPGRAEGNGTAGQPHNGETTGAGGALTTRSNGATALAHNAANGPADELAAIRREGLTGRQLRMARRIAQKHGLRPSSDYDAVRQLRKQGIDPFQRSNMLELVVAEQDRGDVRNLPQTVRSAPVPSTEVRETERVSEIMRIQRDISRRRRRRMALLLARLAFFVFLPTLLAGYYYTKVATPLYATNTEFVIQQADSQGGSPLGGLFSGTSFATSQDSISVQSYLQSRDAMQRLDQDLGFKEHFQSPDIDPIQRLEPDATNEDAYRVYKKNVKIGYDPTEGVVRMEVIATDPESSVRFSEALISYAEEQVDNLTQRLRRDQMAGAQESYEDAETKMVAAQQRVVALQEERGILSAEAEGSMLMGQINTFELELQNERLRLEELQANRRPNEARVAVIQGNIRRLEEVIARLRADMTSSDDDGGSLARVTGELLVAQGDLETRQLMLQQALQQMENARIEANRQTRYLSMAVSPVAPDKPTYPRAFENTALAFLIFAGIYLMASLTASILREQVTS